MTIPNYKGGWETYSSWAIMCPATTPFLTKKGRTDFDGQLSVFTTNLILLDAFYRSFIHLSIQKTFIENLVSDPNIHKLEEWKS